MEGRNIIVIAVYFITCKTTYSPRSSHKLQSEPTITTDNPTWYRFCILGCEVNSFSCIQNLFLEISGKDACVGGTLEKHLVLHLVQLRGIQVHLPRQVKCSEVTFCMVTLRRYNSYTETLIASLWARKPVVWRCSAPKRSWSILFIP